MNRWMVFFLVVLTLGLAILLALLGWMTMGSNLLGWFLFITGAVYFFGVILVYWIRRIQFWKPQAGGGMAREEQGDQSFWLITLDMIFAFYVPPIEFLLLPALLPRTDLMESLALHIVIFGSLLFLWARRTLGKFYAGHVSIVEGQPLVQSGPYRFIRHPAYAGYLLMSFGISFGYSSLFGIAAIVLLLLPAMIHRLRLEDGLLADHFGEEFRKYAAGTKCLLPGIW